MKNRKDMNCENINKIPISATKRTEISAQDVQQQLNDTFQSAPYIALEADESTNDNAQLLLYIR